MLHIRCKTCWYSFYRTPGISPICPSCHTTGPFEDAVSLDKTEKESSKYPKVEKVGDEFFVVDRIGPFPCFEEADGALHDYKRAKTTLYKYCDDKRKGENG